MDYQINACFEEIDRMQHSDSVEKEFLVLKSQIKHSYKFGNKALLMSEILNSVLISLQVINKKVLEIDEKLHELDSKIDFINQCK